MFYRDLEDKANWVRRETLLIHKRAQGTRISSSLSCVEILTVLFYGGILAYKDSEPLWEGRDRLIVSKGHGSIAMYPILSDIGFFPQIELERVCQDGAMLGSIPDPTIPGYECLGGSLGHGLGVACGVALALKRQNRTQRVYCLMGDGELNEGSVWEALMFARHHQIGNLIIIIDANGSSMMGRCQDVLRLGATEPFSCFNCEIRQTDGHSVEQIYNQLFGLKLSSLLRPGVLIANTIKGKGVPELESDPLSHIRNISPDRVDELLKELP